MTAHEDLEEILRGRGSELFHAEILKDQEIDTCEGVHEVASRARGVGFGEIGDEIEGAPDECAVPSANRADRSRGRDVGFPDARWTDQQHATVRRDEACARELGEFRFRQFRIEAPVEIGERLECGEARLLNAAIEEPIGTAGELILDEEVEEIEMRERAASA